MCDRDNIRTRGNAKVKENDFGNEEIKYKNFGVVVVYILFQGMIECGLLVRVQ